MLSFDAATHVYTWQPAGAEPRRLLSVTDVLRRAGMVNTTGFTDEVRERGSRAHAAIALDHDGQLDESTAADVMPWVLTWRRFVAESGLTVEKSEQMVSDPVRGYAGTYDVLGHLKDGKPLVLDIKTGQPQPWVGAQLAAYARCLTGPHARYALHLTPERYALTECRDRQDEHIFLAALTVAIWQVQHGL